jgi:hypothetical protein
MLNSSKIKIPKAFSTTLGSYFNLSVLKHLYVSNIKFVTTLKSY